MSKFTQDQVITVWTLLRVKSNVDDEVHLDLDPSLFVMFLCVWPLTAAGTSAHSLQIRVWD